MENFIFCAVTTIYVNLALRQRQVLSFFYRQRNSSLMLLKSCIVIV